MSTLGIVALVLLAVIATALVVAGAIHVGRERRRSVEAAGDAPSPRWFEVVFAVVLLAALLVAALLFALDLAGDEARVGWRAETRSGLFVAVMLAGAALALVFFVVFLLARLPSTAASPDAPAVEATASPAAARLLGLALLAVAVLLIGWVYLAPAQRAALTAEVLYPATIAVALVLLFDKAARGWTHESRSESVREWLLGDVMVVGLLLGYLNLRGLEDTTTYAGFFWDVVHLCAFFGVFWLLDRTRALARFAVAGAYLMALPLLLALWRWQHDIATPEDVSWWSTIWPTFFLALAFLVLEVIGLIAARGARPRIVPMVKDCAFVVLLAIFLIAAVPGAD